ncbi:uncharacterized protein isoform X1 [Choristoneura fumiferana]|uniref:uncharacterized protein isoform X1 n=1 Tax=Choristoneura fumiferana TaxID=7141 RepID=UPI003D15AF13
MLRYIYLLCFIINFELVFCYNYINSQTSQRRARGKVGRQTEPRQESRLRKRQDYGFEDKLLDQIDVASFIQKPDYDYEPYRLDSKRQPNSHNVFRKFEDYHPAGLPRDRREPLPSPEDPHALLATQDQPPLAPHKLNFAPNDPDARVVEDTTLNNYQQKMLVDRQLVHNPKKKCSLAKMFPFFSHNKAVHDKKGTKKKKPCDTCSKKIKKNHDSVTETEHVDLRKKKKKQERFMDDGRIKKRYAQRTCPKCKMKYIQMRRKRWELPKIIHNSRQYYASLNNAPKETVETSSKQFEKVNIKKRFDDEIMAARSQSHGQNYLSQVKQQFKTLEELERKVENVQI